MKVALTGVTGHVGSAVLRELYQRGHEVRLLVRGNDNRSFDAFPVEIAKGDVNNPESLTDFLEGCDALVHCAGMISIDGDRNGKVWKTNVDGVQNLFTAASEAGVKRVVHISSVHAYDQMPLNEVLNESRPYAGQRAFVYDRSKATGQQIALSMNRDDFQVLVVNPTSVIGPYDFKPSRIGSALLDLCNGKLRYVVRGGFDFCDSRDVANAVVNALKMGTPGESYLLSGKWHSLDEIVSLLSDIGRRQINVLKVPPMLAVAGLPVARLISRITQKDGRYTREALEAVLKSNRQIDSSKAGRDLQYKCRSLEETLHDTIQWFEESGYFRKPR